MKHTYTISIFFSILFSFFIILAAFSLPPPVTIQMIKILTADPFVFSIRITILVCISFSTFIFIFYCNHKINEKLMADEKMKSLLLDHLPGIVFHCKNDEHWTMKFVSQGIKDLCGYTEDEVLQNKAVSWEEIISPEYRSYVRTSYEKAQIAREKVQIEYRINTKDGSEKWVYEQGMFVFNTAGDIKGIDGLIVDITERKKIEAELYRLSIYDHLTGIFNRRYIFERLNLLIEESKRSERNFCIAILDIDFFKRVNDTFGHTFGDYVLCEFATICKSNLRQYDLIGRYGGEEFIIILMNSGRTESSEVIQRIQETIQNHVFSYKGSESSIAFSAGLSCIQEFADTLTRDLLINTADKRLYRAKENGRNKIIDR